MSVEVIHEGSKSTPRVYYDPEEGILRIEGRSITERPEVVYNLIETWIRDHLKRFNQLKLEIFLEYINSGSSKSLRDILKTASSFIAPQYRIKIIWLYEEDDESMLELGEHYRDAAGVTLEIRMVV